MKMYLRGLGIGITVTALILIIAGRNKGKLSDDEIIKRAGELGMIMQESTSDTLFPDRDTTEAPTTETPTTEAPTTEAPTTEAPTTEAPTEVTTTWTVSEEVTADITITKGMFSEAVSQAMEHAGIISDWKDFNEYLEVNGYAMHLQTGTFTMKSSMTYREMAERLVS